MLYAFRHTVPNDNDNNNNDDNDGICDVRLGEERVSPKTDDKIQRRVTYLYIIAHGESSSDGFDSVKIHKLAVRVTLDDFLWTTNNYTTIL